MTNKNLTATTPINENNNDTAQKTPEEIARSAIGNALLKVMLRDLETPEHRLRKNIERMTINRYIDRKMTNHKYEGKSPWFEKAARIVVHMNMGSASHLQRILKIGYADATRLMTELQDTRIIAGEEIVGKPRKVLVTETQLDILLESLPIEKQP